MYPELSGIPLPGVFKRQNGQLSQLITAKKINEQKNIPEWGSANVLEILFDYCNNRRMLSALSNLNWFAIVVAGFIYFLLGGMWFAPFAFQNLWDKSLGFDRPKGWKPTPVYFVGPLIGCILVTFVTAVLIHATNAQSLADAIVLGLVTGVGYAGTISVVNGITPKALHKILLGIIPGIYHIIGIVLVSVILFLWK